jgi:hypothetical protein
MSAYAASIQMRPSAGRRRATRTTRTSSSFRVPCGHAVDSNGPGGSGFDQGRDELVRRFASAGHPAERVWWGNTQSFKQCDGDYAASDGWVVLIELHQVNH